MTIYDIYIDTSIFSVVCPLGIHKTSTGADMFGQTVQTHITRLKEQSDHGLHYLPLHLHLLDALLHCKPNCSIIRTYSNFHRSHNF